VCLVRVNEWVVLARRLKVRFTKHAREKFGFLKRYGFELDEGKVVDVIENPFRVDERSGQCFAVKALNREFGLRVVYERRKDYVVVVTFYPVRRERYGV